MVGAPGEFSSFRLPGASVTPEGGGAPTEVGGSGLVQFF